jgi:hypothetical protein
MSKLRAVTLTLCTAAAIPLLAAATPRQSYYGALAVDEPGGDQWGWAVNYSSQSAANDRAERECGDGCRVVLEFTNCAAYAGGSDGAYGWAYAGDLSSAQSRALRECQSRSGGYCVIRAYGCNARR